MSQVQVAVGCQRRGLSGVWLDRRGIIGRILTRFQSGARAQARLAILDRVTLAPRQALVLVEAEGRKLLVATSPDAAPTFYALDESGPVPAPTGRASC
jgi:hypothetical protein